MRIKIKRITIENFKGIKSFEVLFDPKRTVICGRNETGKTTVADAFFWILFGKDSEFRTKFDVIPLDKNNEAIHHLNTMVEVSLEIDNEIHILKRILSEEWVKKQGMDEEKKLTGTSTDYFIDDSPMKKAEYDLFISSMIDENIFKLLTSTLYFNDKIGWQERRKILTSLIKDYSYNDIVTQKGFALIREEILKSGIDKVEDKYKYQKKEIVKQIEDLPPRIDEVSRIINADPVEGVEEYQEKRSELTVKINDLKTKSNDKFIQAQNEINRQLKEVNSKITSSASNTNYIDNLNESLKKMVPEKDELVSGITLLSKELKDTKERSNNLLSNKEELKTNYIAESKTQFPETSRECTLCGQILPREKLSEVIEKFETLKKEKMDDLKRQAGLIKGSIELLAKQILDKKTLIDQKQERVNSLITLIDETEKNISEYKNPKSDNQIAIDLKNKKELLEKELRGLKPDSFSEEIEIHQKGIDAINLSIGTFEGSQKAKERLASLEKDLKLNNEFLLDIEKQLNLIEKLKIKYIETIEGDINNLFDRKIKVRLFEYQINGGFKESCDILVANRVGALVPWQYVNTAGQINSALQIINQISKHKDIYCPVFIDHAESVETLYEMDTQMIELEFLKTFTEMKIK